MILKVRPWRMRQGGSIDQLPGALVHNRKSWVFIPYSGLRDAADKLHDIADKIEQENTA